MDRREFLKVPLCLAAGTLVAPGGERLAFAAEDDERFTREAAFYKKLPHESVECVLCPRHCTVSDQETGWCGVRSNHRGVYRTHVFGRAVSLANDPIEKKPLFHYRPGKEALSMATVGCNFECQFCQNWEISQFRPEQVPARFGYVPPERLAELAREKGSAAIALTYSEPVIFFEYALAIALAGKAVGVPAVMITNGYIETEPMDQLLAVLGAVKVDFKAFSEDFYATVCRGTLAPVLRTLKRAREKGVWLEMVHLTIPTLNDQADQNKALCDWVLANLGPDVPLHFTRFSPTYKLKNLPPTPPSSLERAYQIAKKAGLHYPYVGNLPGHEGENTYCHHCGTVVIQRTGFTVVENKLRNGSCYSCGKPIPGVWG